MCLILVLDRAAGWSATIPSAVALALPPLQTIKLVSLVTAVVGLWWWGVFRHSYTSISWSVEVGTCDFWNGSKKSSIQWHSCKAKLELVLKIRSYSWLGDKLGPCHTKSRHFYTVSTADHRVGTRHHNCSRLSTKVCIPPPWSCHILEHKYEDKSLQIKHYLRQGSLVAMY